MIDMTVARLTLRGLLGRRRVLLLLALPALLVGMAVLAQALDAAPADWRRPVLVGLGVSVVLPVLALIVGTGVLGAEIDDGTAVHILAKPLPRREIVMTKLAVAVGVTAVLVGAAMLVASLLAGPTRLGLGLLAGSVLGALAYGAVFLALSLVTRRPVLVGLVYVLIWEELLGNLLSGTQVLSIQQYVIVVSGQLADADWLSGEVSVPVSLVMSVVITVGATLLAVDRLRSFTLTGDTS